MREFNTSGPNIPRQHYTLQRTKELKQGLKLVEKERYFTIWAPRQTGKSTFFRQLAGELEKQNYKVAHINFENYKNLPQSSFLKRFHTELKKQWKENFDGLNLGDIFLKLEQIKNQKCVLIIDEVEGINEEYFGDFLHSIRNAYHSREKHCLKSVILVGVSNIVGVVQDNASPFNIADNLNVPYFTREEVFALLHQHELETKQLFEEKVKLKIYKITAGQPGLVNGFAKVLVDRNPDKKILDYNDYLIVENWYLRLAIDKNMANILNKARQERPFVERLLFTEDKIPFKINRPSIKFLHSNGLIKKDTDGSVVFWVPLYRKAVYDAFYPYTNGETKSILRNFVVEELFGKNNELNLNNLINGYKAYVKRRGFRVFMDKDEKGKYVGIKESALIYSFETYIQAFLQVADAKSYREANTGLGKSDLVINVNSKEYIIETKIYYYQKQFSDGKKQLAYYAESLGVKKAVYIVFYPNDIKLPKDIKEAQETIKDVELRTYLVEYDETKW